MHDLKRCNDCGKMVLEGQLVTLSAAEYEQLRKEAEVGRQRRQVSYFRSKSKSRIARDPELASFIVECSDTMITAKIQDACLSRFGSKRAPSRSAIYRFLQSLSAN